MDMAASVQHVTSEAMLRPGDSTGFDVGKEGPLATLPYGIGLEDALG